MKKVLLGSLVVAVLATAVPAMAQAPYNWTGVYLGANVGGGWTSGSNVDVNPLPDPVTFVNLKPQSIDLDGSGVVGGVHAGYNWQWQRFVIGAETDISGSAAKGETTVQPIIQLDGTPFPGSGSIKASQQTELFGTLRPRIGYTPLDRLLIYATGGLAWGVVNYRANVNFLPPGTKEYHVSFQETPVGWTAGAGVEYAIGGNWSLRGEYLYMDLGGATVRANPSPPFAAGFPPFQVRYDFETRNNVARVGLSLKF